MVKYSDIHIEDFKNLSLKSFTEVLLNDYYPFLFSELNKMEDCIVNLHADYDVDILNLTHKKIVVEFDELYRKEKLVLFPYLLRLDQDNQKSENCKPFKNTKLHFTSIINHIDQALEIVSNFFLSNLNVICLESIRLVLVEFKDNMIKLQQIKDKHFYKNYKGCGGCQTL
ncbi:MAG: hypothetical protein KBA06_05365 [Saprospiraceae bacterium]|nr:hypothetical protein [Saprospiraceae bacterium]